MWHSRTLRCEGRLVKVFFTSHCWPAFLISRLWDGDEHAGSSGRNYGRKRKAAGGIEGKVSCDAVLVKTSDDPTRNSEHGPVWLYWVGVRKQDLFICLWKTVIGYWLLPGRERELRQGRGLQQRAFPKGLAAAGFLQEMLLEAGRISPSVLKRDICSTYNTVSTIFLKESYRQEKASLFPLIFHMNIMPGMRQPVYNQAEIGANTQRRREWRDLQEKQKQRPYTWCPRCIWSSGFLYKGGNKRLSCASAELWVSLTCIQSILAKIIRQKTISFGKHTENG